MNDSGLLWVTAVNLILWTGLFLYLVRIDGQVRKQENRGREKEVR